MRGGESSLIRETRESVRIRRRRRTERDDRIEGRRLPSEQKMRGGDRVVVEHDQRTTVDPILELGEDSLQLREGEGSQAKGLLECTLDGANQSLVESSEPGSGRRDQLPRQEASQSLGQSDE
jgi:hypothetical protein